MSSFNDFVNLELPKRPWITVPTSGALQEGEFLQATGVGMELRTYDPLILNESISNLEYSGFKSRGVLGEDTITRGSLLYILPDNSGKYGLAYGINTEPAQYPALVMALEAGDTDDTIDILHLGYVRDTDWSFISGQPVYLSPSSPGAMQPSRPETTGDIVQILGYAITDNILFFNPNSMWIEI